MWDCFHAAIKNVRLVIMRRWLVIQTILLSLTLLLYETVIAALMGVYRHDTMDGRMFKILNATEQECEKSCLQEVAFRCRYFYFFSLYRTCILSESIEWLGPLPVNWTMQHLKVADNKTTNKVRIARSLESRGMEENFEKLWHDLERFEADKQTVQQFERLVVKELKQKSDEISLLHEEQAKQNQEISDLREELERIGGKSNGMREDIGKIQTEQLNHKTQISGLEFSDEKLTGELGKLVIDTEGLHGAVNKLTADAAASSEKINDLETLTQELKSNVDTLMEKAKIVHDVVERIALLAEQTSVMSDRLSALQEHQVVTEKEVTALEATMEKLVSSMRAVDESQIRVSGQMNSLRRNISDHDVLMKELLFTQTRDNKKLRKELADLIQKSTEQTVAFKELKAQTSQTTDRFNALTATLAKVSDRADDLQVELSDLKESQRVLEEEAENKNSMQNSAIDHLKVSQQTLMKQLNKLGNDEVLLASELKQFPVQVNQLNKDISIAMTTLSELGANIGRLESVTDSLKMAISNLQAQQSVKPLVVPVPVSDSKPSTSERLEEQLQLLNMQLPAERKRSPQEDPPVLHSGSGVLSKYRDDSVTWYRRGMKNDSIAEQEELHRKDSRKRRWRSRRNRRTRLFPTYT